ncbi:restriction endonuclease subunit S [Pseudomonas aeruginosa]|uniref:restriction endonuclease subunit S n=1 Tax=Pseudomonas aeruginosa TaxID=287 RepID=UPI00068A36CD|nr:restriction endonuclease subunit S [Pseudomonas aeruginosa]HCL2907370.1 restriction endonuclease subunit S [Pseudomonas aeruginosa 059A]EIU7138262.1 restriction endonuclease subunit S [Pseudomonas aeruginosa]EKV0878930.1 restriction endonuclease subunit S [Pseudomonas aeruginosa]EKX6797928.1 restriction endonuclease subunit S [Pseudomonas aeruginosa]ELX8262104.1 restriction endonuclease subunit S [Pseudomonas aeruginosa]
MSDELPVGWSACTLGDIVESIETGKSVKCDERPPQGEENGLVKISAVTWGTFNEQESKTLFDSSHLKPEEKIQLGDFLISRANTLELVGSCVLVKQLSKNLYLSDKVLRLVLADESKPWLLTCLRTKNGRKQIESLATGNQLSMRNISQQALKEIRIPLPPLAEQTRIAAKLDELLAQADTLKARIDGIPALLKRFRQSVLAAAVSGRLTEEWRKTQTSAGTGADVIRNDQLAKAALLERQPELKKKKSSIESDIDENYLFPIPESWSFTTWGKLSEWITYGFTRPMPKSETGVKLLTAKDVQRFELELMSCGLTTTEAFVGLSDKDKPVKGDLLITKDGSIGRAALVHTNEEFCINQSVAVCWLRSTTMNKRYLELLSNGDFTQGFVKDKAQGMAIQHLSIIDFAKCPVPVPSSIEQDEIVRRVEQLFAFAEQLERKVKSAKSRIDHLTQSILAKAFRGELVPQDPNDEPASVLLERIQTQRATAPKAKRGRKASA